MEPTNNTKTVIVAAISAIIGASGGSMLTELSDDTLLRTQEIVTIQEANKSVEGKYEQLLSGGEKPTDALNLEKITNFPENVRVDVYDGPLGKGYTIIESLPDREVHVSYGPEATDRSKVIINSVVASTTDPVKKLP